jgi:ankyrin repeat protein
VRELNFAHLSVKEYLESDGAPPSFRIRPEDANATMARLGLAFLVSTELSLPFITYASDYWLLHAQKSGQQSYFDLENLVQQFFEAPNASRLRTWTQYTDTLSKRDIARYRPMQYQNPFDSTNWEVTSEDRLFYASFLGFPSICQAFIANGANVNAVVRRVFRGALTGACLGGHKAIVELLLDHGANPDPIDEFYVTPLWAACFRRDVEIVRLLLTEIVDKTSNTLALTLLTAAKFGAVEIVELLLERSVEVNTVENYGHWGNYHVLVEKYSPLRAAITGGDEQVVRILLKHGADVHLGGDRSPLEEAVATGRLRNVQILLDNGADLKQCRSNVIGIAVSHHPKAEHLFALLLSHVSKVDVESGYYDKAFEMARRDCPKSVLRLFEAAGFENRVDLLGDIVVG